MLAISFVVLTVAVSDSYGITWNDNWALGCDFRGNDLKDVKMRGEDCGGRCASTQGCTHFTWTDYDGGTCWMKKNSVSKSDAFESTDKSAVCGIVENSDRGSSNEQWNRADLTNFESYPDPNSDECINYNGCLWAGYFAFVSGKQSESWVKANNIIAIHSKDASKYKLKTLRLKQGNKQIDAKVYDMCSDSDCNGCCTKNSRNTGFLIDIEKYTKQRFGSGSGIVEWRCLDC
ncbi:uncharacterized protein LOC119075136 [Bradysia coprophila]|uniref:uncharacterized protein LOC119075136 n=1 Tax=Bradysia coprophila TaxID=38358 RepID=UPI00187D767B|nr:uncharacterized protein LOC119075136 [Bradysia coprophila]